MTTNPGDLFPDTPLVRSFMDAMSHLNEGFIKADEAIFKLYFEILVEGEKIAPLVIQSMSYEQVMGKAP